jgi:hypothetical protein
MLSTERRIREGPKEAVLLESLGPPENDSFDLDASILLAIPTAWLCVPMKRLLMRQAIGSKFFAISTTGQLNIARTSNTSVHVDFDFSVINP